MLRQAETTTLRELLTPTGIEDYTGSIPVTSGNGGVADWNAWLSVLSEWFIVPGEPGGPMWRFRDGFLHIRPIGSNPIHAQGVP